MFKNELIRGWVMHQQANDSHGEMFSHSVDVNNFTEGL
jgi:hypothetical protein